MKNCLIDLDALFIDPNGKIVKIVTMKAPIPGEPLMEYCSDLPVKYALELPAGSATRLSLRPGQIISWPEEVVNHRVREKV